MNFSEYRSNALKALWPNVMTKFQCDQVQVIKIHNFSTHEIDNICALHWKYDNKISVCVEGLLNYVQILLAGN